MSAQPAETYSQPIINEYYPQPEGHSSLSLVSEEESFVAAERNVLSETLSAYDKSYDINPSHPTDAPSGIEFDGASQTAVRNMYAQWDDLSAEQIELYASGIAMAQKVASQFVFSGMSYQEVLQEAHIGLHDAVKRFNPELSPYFSSYAQMRVKGHIVDRLRSDSTISRSDFNTVKAIKSVENPCLTDAEIATELGLPIKKIQDGRRAFNQQWTESLDALSTAETTSSFVPQSLQRAQSVIDRGFGTVDDNLGIAYANRALSEAISTVKTSNYDRDVGIFIGAVIHGEKLHVLCEPFGISDSRASQICKEIGQQLLTYFEDTDQVDALRTALRK